jgi:hypothetical protein
MDVEVSSQATETSQAVTDEKNQIPSALELGVFFCPDAGEAPGEIS